MLMVTLFMMYYTCLQLQTYSQGYFLQAFYSISVLFVKYYLHGNVAFSHFPSPLISLSQSEEACDYIRPNQVI